MTSACVELRRARPLLGTVVEVAVAAPTRRGGDAAIDAAFAAVEEVQRLMSAHDPASEVSRLGRGAAVSLHPWTAAVLAAAETFRRVSSGLFNIGIAPWLRERGVLPDDSIGSLDVGGIAKGFAVDRAVDALRAAGMARGLVNAGGDLAVFGDRAEVVTLRDPRRPGAVLGRIALANRAVAASGIGHPDAARSAIVDPRSGTRAAAIGATVLAADCMTADALTKLVMLQGCDAAPILAQYGANALFVAPDGHVHATSNWPELLDHAA